MGGGGGVGGGGVQNNVRYAVHFPTALILLPWDKFYIL